MRRADLRSRPKATVLSLLAGAALVLGFAACAPEKPARSLVLVSLDTTRTDRMSLYGYERPTTPWMDEFFAEGTVFERAVAQFNTTVPMHTSLFTATYPHVHRNRRGTGFREDFKTLAEILRTEGFRTGAAVSGFPLKARSSSLDRGFEFYSARFKGARRDGGRTVDRALEWLRKLQPEDRFFLFIHLYDAHGPYRKNRFLKQFKSRTPGPRLGYLPGYQKRFDKNGKELENLNPYLDRYDAQIRYQDHQLERLFAEMDRDQTLVVVTSDHGETFTERGKRWNLNHGHNLYVEQTRIPLAMRGPRVAAARSELVVEAVDVLPTVLELLEIEADGSYWQGESFASVLEDPRADPGDALAFSSSDTRAKVWQAAGLSLDAMRQTHALESRRWKLIQYPGIEGDHFELFNLETDPQETRSVADSQPELVERMSEALAKWLGESADEIALPEDKDSDLDALRALGYVN